MEYFEKRCRENELRVTPQRVAIYQVLLNNTDHPTADYVYQRVKKKFSSISFDTVNRTLLSFAQIGLIGTIECSGQGRKYDPNMVPHHHIQCNVCGKIVDFYHDGFNHLDIPRRVEKNFKITNKRVVLTGVCKQCLKKGEQKNGNKRKRNCGG